MSDLPDFDMLWDYNDPEKSEKAFRNLLPATLESGDSEYHAQLLTQIARTYSLRRDFESAHRILDDAESLIGDIDTTLGQKTLVAGIRYLLERGRTFNSAGDGEAARPLFEEAWKLARGIGEDYHALDAAHMLGICENGDTALKWHEIAMDAAEVSRDLRAKEWLGALYNNTGWTYHDSGQFDRALELFEKGLAWRKDNEKDRLERIRRLGES